MNRTRPLHTEMGRESDIKEISHGENYPVFSLKSNIFSLLSLSLAFFSIDYFFCTVSFRFLALTIFLNFPSYKNSTF